MRMQTQANIPASYSQSTSIAGKLFLVCGAGDQKFHSAQGPKERERAWMPFSLSLLAKNRKDKSNCIAQGTEEWDTAKSQASSC